MWKYYKYIIQVDYQNFLIDFFKKSNTPRNLKQFFCKKWRLNKDNLKKLTQLIDIASPFYTKHWLSGTVAMETDFTSSHQGSIRSSFVSVFFRCSSSIWQQMTAVSCEWIFSFSSFLSFIHFTRKPIMAKPVFQVFVIFFFSYNKCEYWINALFLLIFKSIRHPDNNNH